MANPYILVSSLIFGALAVPSPVEQKVSWIKRLFGLREKSPLQVSAPLPFRPGEELSLGSHLLIELFGCKSETLKAEEVVGLAMRDAADASKATVVAESFHEFKPYGVSGAVIIQESHYTIHTWPEHRYAAVDLFYCGGGVQVHRAVDLLRERFQPERIKFLVVRRGLQHEVEN